MTILLFPEQTNKQTTPTKTGIKTHDFQKPVRIYEQLRPRAQLIARFRAIPGHTETILLSASALIFRNFSRTDPPPVEHGPRNPGKHLNKGKKL